MFRGVTDIANTLNLLLPPWAVGGLIALALVLVFPFWIDSMRIKQISGRARRMVRAEPDVRQALFDQIIDLGGSSPNRLLAIVAQADKYGLRDLRAEAIRRLEQTGQATEDLARLRKKQAPERKPVGHVLEAVVTIERMIEQGMTVAARTRLEEALDRYPGDPELLALQDRL